MEVSGIVSLTKQQTSAVYKMAQKPTPQNKVLENVQTGGLSGGKSLHKKPRHHICHRRLSIRREVDAEPGAKACSMNIPQSVLITMIKS